MSSDIVSNEKRVGAIVRSAQWSTLAMGIGLLAWGLTPLIVQRITSHDPPQLDALAVNSITLLVGATFLGLGLLIRRAVHWALWTSASLSLLLVACALVLSILSGARSLPLFPLVLASCTTLTCWLALAMRNPASAPMRQPEPHDVG